MSYKTLITHVRAGEVSVTQVEAAAALARDLDADLIGLGAETLPPYWMGDSFGGAAAQWIPMLDEQQIKNLSDAKAVFEGHSAGVRTHWRTCRDMPTAALAREARAADLIVAGGAPDKADAYSAVDLAELVVIAGRPVLLAPTKGGRLTPRRVLVAWKDTREARRAVADALPLLRKAEEILVLALCDPEELEAVSYEARDVAGMLHRNGCAEPRVKALQTPAARVDAEILATAESFDADLIVAGGYGHSRAAEWMLGGVTRTLMHHPSRFVLLSH